VKHHYLNLRTGIRLHFVESQIHQASSAVGQAVPVVFCHGWPDFWFTWRHQVCPPLFLVRGAGCKWTDSKDEPRRPLPRSVLLARLASGSSHRTCAGLERLEGHKRWCTPLTQLTLCSLFTSLSVFLQASAYGHQEVVEDLLALLDELHIDKAVFIGHDW